MNNSISISKLKEQNPYKSIEKIISEQVELWLSSDEFNYMLIAEDYYNNNTDIKKYVSKIFNEEEHVVEQILLINNKIVNPFYKLLIDQKISYLMSKRPTIYVKDEKHKEYSELIEKWLFPHNFKSFKNIILEGISKGTGYGQIYYDEDGIINIKHIPSEQIIPYFDYSGNILKELIRVYQVSSNNYETKTIAEYYNKDEMTVYKLDYNYKKTEELESIEYDFELNNKKYKFDKIPFIFFRYNDKNKGLLSNVKDLIDAYDKLISFEANKTEENPRNSLMVIKNHDTAQGNKKGDGIRHNLQKKSIIFVEEQGDVKVLSSKSDDMFTKRERILRSNIFECGRGLDTTLKTLMGNAPSEIALKFMYAELNTDCDTIEENAQILFNQLLFFLNIDLFIKNKGNFYDVDILLKFDRDILISESAKVEDIRKMENMLSETTLLENNPLVEDVSTEIERLSKENNKKENNNKEENNKKEGTS